MHQHEVRRYYLLMRILLPKEIPEEMYRKKKVFFLRSCVRLTAENKAT
jgi:hypothetical protein